MALSCEVIWSTSKGDVFLAPKAAHERGLKVAATRQDVPESEIAALACGIIREVIVVHDLGKNRAIAMAKFSRPRASHDVTQRNQ